MPVEAIPVPLTEDLREPTTLDPTAGQQLSNVRSWHGRVQKFGGLTQLGANQVFTPGGPWNFFEAIFPTGIRRLMALGHQVNGWLHVWDGATWSGNISGAAGRATIGPTSNARYSLVNTLGVVYIAAGGNNNIYVYDPTVVPPGDLIELAHGAALGGANHLTCRVILGFADRLILVRTVENGVDFPNRIRWNAVSTGPTGGFDPTLIGSGVVEVIETSSEPLTGGFVIGERCFLTKAHEILELIATGDGAIPFKIESRVSGTGLISPWSVAVAENVATFIGSDNVFAYNGSQLQVIGDPILDALTALFQDRGNNQLRPQGSIYPRRGEYWLLPFTTGHTIFVYDYRNQRWFEHDMRPPGTSEEGPIAVGAVSASLYGGSTDTQTLVMNGADSAFRTAFILDESVTSRVGYSTATSAFTAQVRTRQVFTKRKGYRGVVEPVATDRLNILWEVTFKGAPSVSVTVVATDADGTTDTQTVTTDAGGRGKAFFNLPWQCLDLTFSASGTGDFRLIGVLSYRWSEGGMQLPADPL